MPNWLTKGIFCRVALCLIRSQRELKLSTETIWRPLTGELMWPARWVRVYVRKLHACARCTGVGDDCGGATEVDGGPDCRLQLLQGGNWLCSNSDSPHPHAQENNSADSSKFKSFWATLNLFFTFLTAKGNHLLHSTEWQAWRCWFLFQKYSNPLC